MKTSLQLPALALLSLLAACGGGGGASGAAGLLPGAARYGFDGLDVSETIVAGSHGEAPGSDLLLGGMLVSAAAGGAETLLYQTHLDALGRPEAAHQVSFPMDLANFALETWSLEHRGAHSAFVSGLHVWGAGRSSDGGWCALFDEANPALILDSVLFVDGGIGTLLYWFDPGSGEGRLAYEEFGPDGSVILAAELPGTVQSPDVCSMGLVRSPDGTEWPVIAGAQAANLVTWIGVVDRVHAEVSITLTTTVSPTEVTAIQVVDAPNADSAWVLATRYLSGTPVVEAVQVRTTELDGVPIGGTPIVAFANTVSFLVASGYRGLECRTALHGAEVGPDSANTLLLAGVTEDMASSERRAVWVAWEGGEVNASWTTVVEGVSTPSLLGLQLATSPRAGRIAVSANVVSPTGEATAVVGELDIETGALVDGSYYDTAFLVHELQATEKGLLLHRQEMLGTALEIEAVREDLTCEFSVSLVDGAGDTILEPDALQRAYSDRGLVAGGSDQGLYVIDLLDPLARADASSVVSDLPPASGPEAAVFGSSLFVVGIQNGMSDQGIELLVPAGPRLVPQVVTPLGITASGL